MPGTKNKGTAGSIRHLAPTEMSHHQIDVLWQSRVAHRCGAAGGRDGRPRNLRTDRGGGAQYDDNCYIRAQQDDCACLLNTYYVSICVHCQAITFTEECTLNPQFDSVGALGGESPVTRCWRFFACARPSRAVVGGAAGRRAMCGDATRSFRGCMHLWRPLATSQTLQRVTTNQLIITMR